LLFLVLSVAAAAQPGQRGMRRFPARQSAPQEPAIPLPVVKLDATVMDSAGKPVPGLTAADFDLTVEGKPQPLSSVQYESAGPRRLVVILDDAWLSASAAERVRKELADFVASQMTGADELSILRTRSGSGDLEAITSDRKVIAAAIAHILPDPAGAMQGVANGQFAVAGQVITLRRALAGLSGIPGRKGVVLMSEHLGLHHHELSDRLQVLAADSSSVVYTVDLSDGEAGSEAAGLPLAVATGGLNLGRELAAGLARALHDEDGYYLFSYVREGEFVSRSFQLDAPPSLQLKTRNTAFTARARISPVMASDEERNYRARTEYQELVSAVNSPFDGEAIRVQVTGLFGNSRAKGPSLTALVWIEAGDLSFTHQLNGRHKASAEVVIAAFGSTGLSAGQTSAQLTLDLDADEYKQALLDGVVVQSELDLREPGFYQVRVTARDETSGRMGKASQFVAAPNISSGDLMLSGIVLREKDSKVAASGPARRIFAPGARVTFTYEILNPGAEVETLLHLIRDGREVFTGRPQSLGAVKLEDPKRRPVAGEVTLSTALPNGQYYLEVSVRDTQSAKPRTARQGIDFQIRR
jgi:VWFA-related protein